MTEQQHQENDGMGDVINFPGQGDANPGPVAPPAVNAAPNATVAAAVAPAPAPTVPARRERRVVAAVVRRIPARYRDRDELKAMSAARATRVAVSPKTFTLAAGRGSAVAGRAWKRWVSAEEFRAAAKESGQLAQKWQEIRHQALIRWGLTGGYATGGVATVGVADLLYGSPALWAAGATTASVLAILGRRKDDAPGRKAVVGARTLSWAMDGGNLQEVFVNAGLIKKGEKLSLVHTPRRDAEGWLVTVDLPPGRKASDAIKASEALASALAVDEGQLFAERARGGDGDHSGRLRMWIADTDPYAAEPARSPLADAETWDFWRPAPFGQTARGARVTLPLVWSSLLTGAIPRMGKTYCARITATAAALDPYVRLIVFDGKGGKDWRPFEAVAHRFGRGDNGGVNQRLLRILSECVDDIERRFQHLGDLDDEVCPESKVTPAITRDPAHDMPLTLINIDEVQVYLEDDTMVETGEVDNNDKPKLRKRGAIICDLLTYIIKKGPACGYMLNLATQKPDSDVIPAKLRDNAGTRFALKTMTYQASNCILGPQASKAGYDSSKLLTRHKGVGLLMGTDGETDLDSGDAVTVRTDLLAIADIRAACERGRAARIAAGTLAGDAVGDATVTGGSEAAVRRAVDQVARDDDAVDDEPIDDDDGSTSDAEPTALPAVMEAIAETVEAHETGWVSLASLADRMDDYADGTALGTALHEAGHGVGGDSPLTGRKRVVVEGKRTANPVAALDLDALSDLLDDALGGTDEAAA